MGRADAGGVHPPLALDRVAPYKENGSALTMLATRRSR